MTRRSVGIVDYGVGNVASVRNSLTRIGYRCRLSGDANVLAATDVLILPGVGAFPAAMEHLRASGLADFVTAQARAGRPLIGICLGMQLLVDESIEQRATRGLGLIEGRVVPMTDPAWHIGWNTIESDPGDPLIGAHAGAAVYFNHSFALETDAANVLCTTRGDAPFVSGVRRGNIVGLQFHPEKSQLAGRAILRSLIEGLCDA